jgi:fatty acid desaturase
MTMLTPSLQSVVSPPEPVEEHPAEVCIANISPRERRKRLLSGIPPFVLALGILGALLAAHAAIWWRVPLFLLFAAATTGFFQWRDKT